MNGMKCENDDECVFVYPPGELFQVKITPGGIDIYYGKDQEDRGDLTILRVKILRKGLSLKTFDRKEFKRSLRGIGLGDSVVLPVDDW